MDKSETSLLAESEQDNKYIFKPLWLLPLHKAKYKPNHIHKSCSKIVGEVIPNKPSSQNRFSFSTVIGSACCLSIKAFHF